RRLRSARPSSRHPAQCYTRRMKHLPLPSPLHGFKLLVLVALLSVLASLAPPAPPAVAQAALDYDVPSGHFYTQARGQSGASGRGFAVTDESGIPFWTFFRAVGGVAAVGYPVTHRFQWDGFTVQAFQKVVFQWRPEAGTVYYVNVIDQISLRGGD